tara:strand:+ start:95 stop:1495 length:1401 start_codon:yes stop_codon:yes gene_type:complete
MKDSIMGIRNEIYNETIDEVRKIRDCVQGEFAIKKSDNALIYLPNPNDLDKTSNESKERYRAYKARAEFDGFTGATLTSLNGAMWSTSPLIELPSEVDYLISNSDGDGTSLNQSMALTASNVIQVGYHFLLADYDGQNAYIKHYPRESVVDWDFDEVNGVNQINFVKLAEIFSHVDKETFQRKTETRILILALDDDGDYYQQKIEVQNGVEVVGEKVYPMMDGATLKSIPCEIVTDEIAQAGQMPVTFGVLYPIALKAIARYQVNADLKEMIHRNAQPTLVTDGWESGDSDIYQEMNGGKDFKLGSNGALNFPKKVKASYLEAKSNDSPLFKYLEDNQKEVKAFGGSFDTSEAVTEAVGVAKIRSAEQLRALTIIANAIEAAYTNLIGVCYGFMSTKSTTPEFILQLNKEFNASKLEPTERAAIINEYNMGVISLEEAHRQLKSGGALQGEIDVVMQELEMSSGTI